MSLINPLYCYLHTDITVINFTNTNTTTSTTNTNINVTTI